MALATFIEIENVAKPTLDYQSSYPSVKTDSNASKLQIDAKGLYDLNSYQVQ
ncbi:MAG: hypothetical protein PHI32_00045 [Dysgonamonadaceae bacterium]|nr:hypothetical protein [Dysgonamonadaceae bacterium]MDD4728525.1 hypothetical protein [Dysgonamonadaceae bacterium]